MSARLALLLLLIHGNAPPTWPTTATLTSWHTLPYSLIATPSVLSHTTLVLLESALPSTPLSPLRTRGETSWSPVRRTLQHLPVLLTLWVWGGGLLRFFDSKTLQFPEGCLDIFDQIPKRCWNLTVSPLRAGAPSRIRHGRDHGPSSPIAPPECMP